MIRKATFFDFANLRLYLEMAGLNQEQTDAVYKASFTLGRICMIIGFFMGLFLGMWVG